VVWRRRWRLGGTAPCEHMKRSVAERPDTRVPALLLCLRRLSLSNRRCSLKYSSCWRRVRR
jgi:hypothetical protein